jgi:hypothetical protein
MPDQNPPPVSSERVMDIIQRDTIGGYLLRAAIAEATCEVYREQLAARDAVDTDK